MPVQNHFSRSAKRLPLLLLAAATLASAVACGGKEATTPSATPPETPVPTLSVPSATPSESPAPAIVAPLTGLPADREVTNRPFAVMINNLAPARPQSGLTQADVIWEVLAEGGITRLVAIFQSKSFADPIGPVRSIRPYYIELGELYNAVLVHAGASNDGFAILQGKKKQHLDEITNAGAYFWRDKSRKAPHNVYTDLEKLRAGAEKLKYPDTAAVPKLTFSESPDLSAGAPATEVTIKFQLSNYKLTYRYDTGKGTYARFINGEPHVDKNNDEQLTAANLVVLATKHVTLDKEGRLEVDLKSGGDAYLIQRGQALKANWVRDKDMIRITKDGKELPFLPGTTYYHIVPNASPIDQYVTFAPQ
jgi:thiol-disulfide isomerase/thioredoxin